MDFNLGPDDVPVDGLKRQLGLGPVPLDRIGTKPLEKQKTLFKKKKKKLPDKSR